MTPQTAAELLDLLDEKQLLEPAQVTDLRAVLADFADARTLARELLSRDWLTPYQANQVLQGKSDVLLLGPYRVRERLAEGAMGQVFKAWHPQLRRAVAIKMMHGALVASGKARERFHREVRLAAQLDHPNIVRARDADEVDSRLFLVMDFVEGTNLAAIVRAQGPLPIAEALDCARQTALGLQHAFERGIVHRDIKPSNLMAVGGVPTTIKILDFGLARFESEGDEEAGRRLTQFGKILGTIDYISPEQAADSRSADIRADIYSLGCTLYFLLTGKPAFPGNDLVAKLLARQDNDPPSVRVLRPEVAPALDAVLRKLMARRPEDRYQTPAEAADALRQCTAPPVPLAQPVVVAADVPLAVPVGATGDDYHFATSAPVAVADEVWAFEQEAPPRRKPAPRRPPRLWLFAGGGALVLLLLGGLGLLLLSRGAQEVPKDGYYNGAALQFRRVRLSVIGEPVLYPGEWKKILVEIQRDKFKGPVKVYVDPQSLPPDLSVSPLTIAAKEFGGEMRLMVTNGADPGELELKVIAVAKNLTAEKILPVKIATRAP
jgi:serine/threonine protein kinase